MDYITLYLIIVVACGILAAKMIEGLFVDICKVAGVIIGSVIVGVWMALRAIGLARPIAWFFMPFTCSKAEAIEYARRYHDKH